VHAALVGRGMAYRVDLPCPTESHCWEASGGIESNMAVTDIASRTYNHGWRLDPIVRSLLDTDFYKLLMLQMIGNFIRTRAPPFGDHRSRHVVSPR